MKTITFYSYKGGVGRSLCLANIATRLSEFGKKVCLLDFDLEAPGLHYKFNKYVNTNFKNGIVDYIFEFVEKNTVPNSIHKYSYDIRVKSIKSAPMRIIPAGNVYTKDYWSKLSSIDWNKLFYGDNSQGIPFFLDLKQKIKEELKPDFLLIDSRTGITEIGGIGLSLFADEIVLLASYNEENIEGSKNIIVSLLNKENQLGRKTPKINFVITRIPFPSTPKERANEKLIKESTQKRINSFVQKSNKNFTIREILTIHSDRELELKETLKINDERDSQVIPISRDYIKLFEEITKDELTPDEVNKFKKIKESQKLVEKGNFSEDNSEKIELFTKAIELNPNNTDAYIGRGVSYHNLDKIEEARKDFLKLIKLIPNHYYPQYIAALTYMSDKNYENALTHLNAAIEINPHQSESLMRRGFIYHTLGDDTLAKKDFDNAIKYSSNDYSTYNARANWYRLKEKYDLAYNDIYKAIELNPQAGIAYGTLAEIKAAQNQLNDFYVNLELALSLSTKNMSKSIKEEEIYKRFFKDNRFINLLAKYNIEL